jgi:putative addiction module killer protein
MLQPVISINMYETPNGKCPFDEWFSGLRDRKTQMVVDARLTRLRQGNFGNFKSVGAGVLELKIAFGPGFRVYFGVDGNTVVVLLCGGDKGSQERDIRRAQEYWADYLEE